MMIYDNCFDAIRDGNGRAPCVIGWLKCHGWILYDPRNPAPVDVRPELLCCGLGSLPIPLSEEGKQIFKELLNLQKENMS